MTAPYAQSPPPTIETLQLAPPAEGELLIKVRAAGSCHSDLSVIHGSRPRVMPMVLGHEAAGVVEACGPGVTAFAPGDHVVFSFVPVCGHCEPCASGRAALCEPGAAANVAGTLLGAVAVASGAYPLAAVDVNPDKLTLARELGASHCIRAGKDVAVPAQVKAAIRGGVDVAIETVGHEQVLADAYHATRRGGTTITVGLPHPSRMISLPAVSLVAEERTLKGSYMGSCVPSRDLPRFVALYRAGRLPVDRLLTHTLTLDEVNEGFDRLARGEAVRQVVVTA